MKIELIERGGKYYLRRKTWGGLFTEWWIDIHDGGWRSSRSRYEIQKSRAEELLRQWAAGAPQKSDFEKSKDSTVATINL